MSERDTDIEFDFFDEPETEEAPERPRITRRPPGGGPPARPRMRAPQGFIPMLRLAGLIAFLILAVIVLIFLLRGCASDSKHAKYSGYMDKMRTIGHDSAQLGRQLNSTLAATGIKETELESRIKAYAATQQQQADQADSIDPPGPLHSVHDHAVEVLQLRASGLRNLADAFAKTATAKDASALPWSPAGDGPLTVPWIRRQTDSIACDDARSGFTIIVESGTLTFVTPWFWSTRFASSVK